MKLKKHWTPRYLFARINEYLYRKKHPDEPWLTPAAIQELCSWLTKDKVAIELGSGRSTYWFAKRCKHIVSVESDQSWFAHVRKKLDEDKIENVNYIFAPVRQNEDPYSSPYLKPLLDAPDQSFDFALVDGDYRGEAALTAITKVKPGGLLMVDNANWFLPSSSKSPSSVGQKQKPATKIWEEFSAKTQDWKKIWTSNGVTDTALFFKP